MEKRRDSGLAAIAMLVLLLIVAASLISIFASRPAQAGTAAEPALLSGYWTEDSVPAQKLRDYVAKVTDPNDTANYIRKRIVSPYSIWTARSPAKRIIRITIR